MDKDDFYRSNYKHVSDGLVSAVNIITGETCSVTKEEYSTGNYQGINKGRICGSKNPNAKTIEIYDDYGNLRYTAKGNFKKICVDNSLPFAALRRSYSLGGVPIFSSKKTLADAKRMGKTSFIGWYAKQLLR